MAQTKFVLGKALAKGLRPLVVFNKVDRPSARLGDVEGEVFDLFVSLEATDEQLDFPMVRTAAVLVRCAPCRCWPGHAGSWWRGGAGCGLMMPCVATPPADLRVGEGGVGDAGPGPA